MDSKLWKQKNGDMFHPRKSDVLIVAELQPMPSNKIDWLFELHHFYFVFLSINNLYFELAEFHSKTGFNFIAFAPVGTNSSEVAKSKKSQIFVYTLTSTLLLTKNSNSDKNDVNNNVKWQWPWQLQWYSDYTKYVTLLTILDNLKSWHWWGGKMIFG